MAEDQPKPDLLAGVALGDIPDSGLLAGTVGEHDAVLVRAGDGFRAVGAKCTHLGAPMAKGLLVGGELRCPWHHACFDVATGRATKAPAFDPLPVWPVAVEDGRARVTQAEPVHPPREPIALAEGPFVIVGGGAAGYSAAVALKEGAPRARVIVLSADDHAPYDRTILTKDYLDGKFGDDRLPISKTDLAALGVELRLSTAVERIDRERRAVVTKLIHKFRSGLAAAGQFVDDDQDIFVLVDESHRSQAVTDIDSLHAQMRKVLPRAAYIGFTGTPLLKSEKSTFDRFCFSCGHHAA